MSLELLIEDFRPKILCSLCFADLGLFGAEGEGSGGFCTKGDGCRLALGVGGVMVVFVAVVVEDSGRDCRIVAGLAVEVVEDTGLFCDDATDDQLESREWIECS